MNLTELGEQKRAELAGELGRIVDMGCIIRSGKLKVPVPEEITHDFIYDGIKWHLSSQLGDLHVMRAVPEMDGDGAVVRWRMRVRWAVPWWDDSYTKDHHRFEIDRWVFGFGGHHAMFYGFFRDREAVMIQSFPNPEEDEEEIIDNYRRWQDYRRENADMFLELDARVEAYELEVMREHDTCLKRDSKRRSRK